MNLQFKETRRVHVRQTTPSPSRRTIRCVKTPLAVKKPNLEISTKEDHGVRHAVACQITLIASF